MSKGLYIFKTTSTQMASTIFDTFEGEYYRVFYNRDTGEWKFHLKREPKEWELV